MHMCVSGARTALLLLVLGSAEALGTRVGRGSRGGCGERYRVCVCVFMCVCVCVCMRV